MKCTETADGEPTIARVGDRNLLLLQNNSNKNNDFALICFRFILRDFLAHSLVIC